MNAKFLLALLFTTVFGIGHKSFLLSTRLRYRIALNKEHAIRMLRQKIIKIATSKQAYYKKKPKLDWLTAVLNEMKEIDPITERQTSRRDRFSNYHTNN